MKILPTNISSFVSRVYDNQMKIFFFVAFFLHAHVHMKKQFFSFFFFKASFQLATYYILVYHVPKIQLLLWWF